MLYILICVSLLLKTDSVKDRQRQGYNNDQSKINFCPGSHHKDLLSVDGCDNAAQGPEKWVNVPPTDNGAGCKFNPLKEDEFSPLPKFPNENKIMYPVADGKDLQWTNNEQIEFACTGNENSVKLKGKSTSKTLVNATCSNGKFKIDMIDYSWEDIRCTQLLTVKSRQIDNPNFNAEIGYELNTEFIPYYSLYFDKSNQISKYTYHELWPLTRNKVKNKFVFIPDDGFFGKNENVNDLYSQKTQKVTINTQLGFEIGDNTYINDNHYLTRGHLSPKGDFFYFSQKNGSFRYINAVPQWNSLNDGIWNTLEISIRKFAISCRCPHLQIWTGTYNILTLPDSNKDPKQLFLYVDETTKAIPVPQYIWKIVYEPIGKKGVAFISFNYPYEKNSENLPCEDTSSNWFKWKGNIQGFFYECTLTDFGTFFHGTPNLEDRGLLETAYKCQ